MKTAYKRMFEEDMARATAWSHNHLGSGADFFFGLYRLVEFIFQSILGICVALIYPIIWVGRVARVNRMQAEVRIAEHSTHHLERLAS